MTIESSDDKLIKDIKVDYAYLDKLPLEGWVWEFIRRNKGYIALRQEIAADLSSIETPKKKSNFDSIISIIRNSPTQQKILALTTDFNILVSFSDFEPIDADNFLYIEKINLFANIPNPGVKFNEFHGDKPQILGASCVKAALPEIGTVDFVKLSLPEREKRCNQMVMFELTPTFYTDTLYLGISLSAPKKEIRKQIDNLLKKHIKDVEIRMHDKKWKFYLIAYDLVNAKGIAYEDAVEIFRSIDDKINEQKAVFQNMVNNINGAEELINGGYKKFLHFKNRHIPYI